MSIWSLAVCAHDLNPFIAGAVFGANVTCLSIALFTEETTAPESDPLNNPLPQSLEELKKYTVELLTDKRFLIMQGALVGGLICGLGARKN